MPTLGILLASLLLLVIAKLLSRLPLLLRRFGVAATRKGRAGQQALLLLVLTVLAAGLHGLFSSFGTGNGGLAPQWMLRLVASVVGLLVLHTQARVLLDAYRHRHAGLEPAGPYRSASRPAGAATRLTPPQLTFEGQPA